VLADPFSERTFSPLTLDVFTSDAEMAKLLKAAKKENAALFFENSKLKVDLTKQTDVLEENIKRLQAELVSLSPSIYLLTISLPLFPFSLHLSFSPTTPSLLLIPTSARDRR